MPAATSLEDIYHISQSGGLGCGANSLSSSYSPTSNLHLPDYYLQEALLRPLPPTLTVACSKPVDSDGANGPKKSNKQSCQLIVERQRRFGGTQAVARRQPQLSATAALAISNSRSRQQKSSSSSLVTYQKQQQQQQKKTYLNIYSDDEYDLEDEHDFRAAEMSNCERVPLGRATEPLLFLYHDADELSTSSAPDSFLSSIASHASGGQAQEQSGHQAVGGQQQQLTIEELRLALNSCCLCGCNWQQLHVSLDCPECGGYALERPCPQCEGRCQQVWRRNINASHDYHKALWVGECFLDGRQADCCSAAKSLARDACQLRQLELRSDDDDEDDDYDDSDASDTAQHQRGLHCDLSLP